MDKPIDLDTICKYVGRLYLQTQQEIDRLLDHRHNPLCKILQQKIDELEKRCEALARQNDDFLTAEVNQALHQQDR